jgi:3D (Asp-Asp-Asp) domain-containing protein
LAQGRGGDEFQPGGILQYFEELKRGTNQDIGPKDIFEVAFKNMSKGGAVIKNYITIHILAFAVILGVAFIATDEPDIYSVKSLKSYHSRMQQPVWLPTAKDASIFDSDQKSTPAKLSRLREVTAYNVGDPDQNYGDPCESANGEDICAALDSGSKRCAANFVPFGTVLHIAHYGVCTVTDRMNRRYSDHVDIAMKKHEKHKAIQFGRRRLKVTVLATREG